jgi:hypothetical protein
MKRVILIVFAILLAAVLIANRSESVFGADSSGYANLARMLDRGETTRPWPRASTASRIRVRARRSHGVVLSDRPADHLALFARIAGWAHGPFFVSPLAGVALVLLTFWLGKRLHPSSRPIAALLTGFCACSSFRLCSR